MVTKEDLQHFWVLYSMQGEVKSFERCIEIFLELYRKYLLDHNSASEAATSADGLKKNGEDADIVGGPHLSSLPDGFLPAVARCLHRFADSFVNKPSITEPDVFFAESLLKTLIIVSRNVDNLPQLASSTCVGDGLVIASIFLEEEFSTKLPRTGPTEFIATTLTLLQCLHDPYTLWTKLVRKRTLNADVAIVHPPLIHPNAPVLILKCFEKRGPSHYLTVCALNALGSILVGSKQNGISVASETIVNHLFTLLKEKAISCDHPETNGLILRCLALMVHTIHEVDPDQRQVEVAFIFTAYLHTLRSLPVHDEDAVQTKLEMLSALHELLSFYDRAALQVVFIGVGIFEQLIQITQQGADVVNIAGGMLQAVSSIRVLAAILRGSVKCKELFTERIGYRMLLDVLTTITEPSKEFVEALIELVVESPEKDFSYLVVANPAAAVMLLDYASVLKSSDLQLLIINHITELLGKRMHSRIQCASCGMLSSILQLFKSSPQLRPDVADNLVRLFEILASHSIEPGELKKLLQLLKKDEEGFQPSYISRLMHSVSVIASNTSSKNPFRYFDIQGDYDGIVVPSMRKKWPGPGFTFHAWVSLDDRPVTTTVSADSSFIRRILYSVMNNSGGGFEAFFTYDCVLVVAVSYKKEYIALSLTDHPLRDCRWHCIDIIHAPPRRPFGSSTLSVYIDGRLVHATNMKMPNLYEPFCFLRIGSAPVRVSKHPDALSHIGVGNVHKAPSSPMSPRLPALELITIHQGTQNDIFGTAVSLKGQINSICIFHDAILPSEVKELVDGGPNIVFRSDDVGDLATKLFLYYHSNGCQAQHCSDLSPQRQNDGTFSGSLSTAWSLANSLSCIGGLPCLFPILEQANAPVRGAPLSNGFSSTVNHVGQRPQLFSLRSRDCVDAAHQDWVLVDKTSTDSCIDQNPVAAFLGLLRKILVRNIDMQEDIVQMKSLPVVGFLLAKVDQAFLDVNVLFAVQLLVEAAQGSHVWMDFLTDFYQYILFDFKIWVKAEFTIRLGHLQYIRKLVKDDRKLFRKKFGVQLFLDALRTYYTKTSPSATVLAEDEGDILRKHTLGIVQEFVCQNINHQEVSALIKFVLTVKCEKTIDDTLDLILSILENHAKSDQIYLLLFEPYEADSLFCLLLKRQIPQETKAKIMSVFNHLLKSAKVYEKSKTRLRLLDVGMGGALMLMPNELPVDFAKIYFEQYFAISLDHPAKYSCIIALFNKLHHAPINVKMDFARKFLYAIYMKPGAAVQIAAQPGWYHSLAGLFIESAMAVTPASEKPSIGSRINDLIDLKSPEEEVVLFEDLVDSQSVNTVDSVFHGDGDGDNDSAVDICREALEEGDHSPTPSHGSSRNRTRSDNASRSEVSFESTSHLNRRPSRTVSHSAITDTAHDELLGRDAFTFLDDSLTSSSPHPESAADELCSVILNILSTVMWQGIEGSNPQAWGKRVEVILSLDMVALSNYLYKKPEELKRRLYELAIQMVISEVRKDLLKTSNVENAELVIRLVHDFITAPDLHTNLETKLSDKLLEDFSLLLDAIKVWETDSADGWSEVLQMGIDVLLTVMRCPDLKYCSIIIPKLHYVIQCRLHCSRREICYILAALNDTLMMSIDMGNQEHFSFVVPVLRVMLEKWSTTLSSTRYLPNLPALNVNPQNYSLLQKYFRSPEWGNFIGNHIAPLAVDYQNGVCKIRKEKMSEFWNEAHDSAMAQLHNRNQEYGTSKLRFHQMYIEPARKRAQEENYRFNCQAQDLKSESAKTLRKWDELKRYLFRERGPWRDKNVVPEIPLKMSHHENFARMRLKLVENLHFDMHLEASQLRDNTAPLLVVDKEPPHINVAKEAKVDHAPEDSLIEDDIETTATSRPPSNEKPELVQREKLVIQEPCDLVTITEIVQGRFELTTQRIKFHAMNPAYDATTGESYSFEISIASLREIHLRRYNLRRSALEFFLVDQTNYFINFTLKSRNAVYKKVIGLKPTGLIYYKHSNPASLLKASGITQKWVVREISNFEYLMALNTIAGRTYNDLSQYPVFPWVLRDYTTAELDLNLPATFRDFSRPMGVQNPKGIAEVKHKFENFEDPTGTIDPFHYGQHYSNPASVIHYLVRLEPFTTLHIQLQSGRFDVADRQFHSIAGTWDLLWNNPNDVKELIPEFFYLPEFLTNMNNFDLGCLQQSKDSVTDVLLPPWAKTPEEFVYRHRIALESDYVSSHLHDWIDLIFGYKQRGPDAVDALNVFYYCTYEGAVDLDAILDPIERQATEGMINNFGQTPCQLLKEPHPARLTFDEATRKYAGLEGRSLNVFYYTKYLKAFLVEANTEGDPLVFITVPKIQGRSLHQQAAKSDLITIGRSGALGLHIWTPFDQDSPKNMTFERDPRLMSSKYARNIAGPFHPSLTVNSNMFAVTADCKLLFYGGNWDNSLRVYNFAKGKTTAQVIRHRDLVTCLSLDSIGLHLITGSRDTTCMVWEILQQNGASCGINGKSLQTLYGHDAEVTCVAMCMELDMAISGSKDATIIVHTVRQGLYVRTLQPTRTIPPSPRNFINRIAIMSDGKIAAACYFAECRVAKHSLELYSLNGKHLFTEPLLAAANDLAISDDFIVTGDAVGRLEIREWFQLKLIYSMQVADPITSVAIPKSCSHILAGLQDGKLIIVTVAPNIADVMAGR